MKGRGCAISIGAIIVVVVCTIWYNAYLLTPIPPGMSRYHPMDDIMPILMPFLTFIVLPLGILLEALDFVGRRQATEPRLAIEEELKTSTPKEALPKPKEIEVIEEVPGVLEQEIPEETKTVIRERIVTERVLVICPFCGAKNEQGITKCQSCGAEV